MVNNNSILFENIEDFVRYVPNVVKGIDFEKIKTNCMHANNKHLFQLVDPSIFTHTDDRVIELLKNAQANYAAFEMTLIANTILTKSGSVAFESETMKSNFPEKQDALAFYSETGDAYLDLLLAYLKENDIDNSKQVSTTFFSCVEDFDEFIDIGGSLRTFLALVPAIKKVENICIIPRLEDKLQDVISEETLAPIRNAIRGYVANSAMLASFPKLKISYSPGITVSTFLSSMQSKFNKEESKLKMESIKTDVDDYLSQWELELNKLFAVEIEKFENKTENKGFSF